MVQPDPSAPAVDSVDLARYAGKWFEVASIPSIASAFGRCTNTTAIYTPQDDGTVRLFNECFLDRPDGAPLTIAGRARALDETNARLGILFDGWVTEATYNIIDLDPDYQWAVVGSGQSGLFILSRTPVLDATVYDDILSRLPLLGYDPDRLLATPQFTE
jgi:apolipoprotein D and lipocalin family protein